MLPADYVAKHVDLGYAVTAHRAQGITTDTSHVLVEPTSTRENFYVAMSRGKETNQAWVILDRPDDTHSAPHPSDNEEATGRSVLYGVLSHSGAELSAHETITAEQDHWGSIAQLAAEYETIASAAQHDRWASLIRASGLTDEQADAAFSSEAFGALTAELRRAEANHHDVDALFPRLVAARGFEDADDIAKVMHYRVARATTRPAGSGRTRKTPALIAGLIPHATGPMSTEMRDTLAERRELIEHRADAILDTAIDQNERWTEHLGEPPTDERAQLRWQHSARTIAAYRARYGVDHDTPLGVQPESAAQKIDHAHAATALRRLTPHTTPERDNPRHDPVGAEQLGPSL